MPKTKLPFFSLEAHGSVGGSITAQRVAGRNTLREKPFPTDPYTLRQAYQRWIYRDCAYQWTLLTPAQKQVYATAGSRQHLTGFQYYLKSVLPFIPHLIAWWRLDETTGAIAFDSSPYDSPGTIIGATPADGAIAGAYYFDGINDLINCGSPAHLPFGKDLFAVGCYIQTTILARGGIVTRWTGVLENWFLELQADGTPRTVIFNNAGGVHALVAGPVSVADGAVHHLFMNWDPDDKLELFVDGVSVGIDNTFTLPVSVEYPDLHIGQHRDNSFKGIIDNVMIFDELQTSEQIARWSERRY